MLPTLLSLGPITIKTLNVFLVLAFLYSGFVFWRRGREDHYREDQLFDGFVISAVVGLVFARMAFCVFQPEELSTGWQCIDLLSKPGWIGSVGLTMAGLTLIRFSKKQKWDPLAILDMWVTAMAAGMVVMSIGMFASGDGWGGVVNISFLANTLPITQFNLPVPLLTAGLFWGFYRFLLWIEQHYRLFTWYKKGRSVAQTGFVTAVAMIGASLILLIALGLQMGTLSVSALLVRVLVYVLWLILGIGLLFFRSGVVSRHVKKSARHVS